jgi:predicted metal-dependent phosphoesterase TrpH
MKLSMAETVAAIHEQGGMAFLAHPFFTQMSDIRIASRAYRRDPEYLLRAGLDGLEGYNSSVVVPGANRVAQRVARFLGLAITGGSDAHTLGAVGVGYTLFAGRTADDLRAALRCAGTSVQGRPWPMPEYAKFVADFISRRGKIICEDNFLGEEDADSAPVSIHLPY